MRIKYFIKKQLNFFYNFFQEINQKKDLNKIPKDLFNIENLKQTSDINLKEIFNQTKLTENWNLIQKKKNFKDLVGDITGGVNPGDRRAIYYLIAKLQPNDVLEIGTHIGASTVYIASALASNYNKEHSRLTTIDIRDVNSIEKKPWVKFGMKYSPMEMINILQLDNQVDFITDTSINFFKNCDKKFDLIFLDGDHSAKTVYVEIALALKSLKPNGVILLHDYFPNGKPLWSDRKVGKGPFLAVERIKKEGCMIKILPLGTLPWATKLASNITSLALCLK